MTAKSEQTPSPAKTGSRLATDFACRVPFYAPRVRVFDAIATIDGLRGWWTPFTSGAAAQGDQLRFEFSGWEESITMQVDRTDRPASVCWTCLMHTELTEWNGTKVTFEIRPLTPETCELSFRHIGLTPLLQCYDDCQRRWAHFLASLVAYVERGKGMPFELKRTSLFLPRISHAH